MSARFENVPVAELVRFAGAYPLAWIVPIGAPSEARLMPLIMELGTDGQPSTLLGHLPIKSPATEMLREKPAAICLFLGPNANISREWISKPGWAPTWNFVSFKVTGTLVPDETLTEKSIRGAGRLATHERYIPMRDIPVRRRAAGGAEQGTPPRRDKTSTKQGRYSGRNPRFLRADCGDQVVGLARTINTEAGSCVSRMDAMPYRPPTLRRQIRRKLS